MKQKKLWNELIVIQIFENDKLNNEHIVNNNIKLESLYESPINENVYIRFSKVKL